MIDFFSSPIGKGIRLLRKQKYAEARDYFINLIEQNIELAQAYFNLGRCDFKLGLIEESKGVLHRALELEPTPEMISDILEITNWQMLSSYSYCNSWPEFSPDGKLLAYVSARRDSNGDGRITPDDCGAIYIIDLENGGEHVVVNDESYNLHPVFSPDCTKLSYLSVRRRHEATGIINTRANPGLYIMDLTTGQETLLLDDSYRPKYQNFLPDGKKLIFSCWKPGEKNSGIYTLEIETGKLETVIDGTYENAYPQLAPSGDKIVFSSWRRDTNDDGFIDFHDNSGIFFTYLFGDDREKMIATDRYNNSFPSFSPDGRQLLFLSVRRDTNRDGKVNALDNPGIYLYDLIRNKEQCIVKDNFFNKFASFTPDGRHVIFVSNWRRARGGDEESNDLFENKGVYSVDLSTREIRQIVSDKYYGCRSAVVSPRGDCVAYVAWRHGTNRGLYLAYLDRFPSLDEIHSLIDQNL